MDGQYHLHIDVLSLNIPLFTEALSLSFWMGRPHFIAGNWRPNARSMEERPTSH